METLPYLALERIVQHLTPADLARCSAVCREWRETFNQDWMWKPHCDPELEEPLRTIPRVAPPTFVTPEVEDSTLSPICYWRLAFMREKHLWNNWRREDFYYKKRMIGLANENNGTISVQFLTDTLIVVWHKKYIKVYDVSLDPEVCVAETKLVDLRSVGRFGCQVIGSTMLLVKKECSVEIYSVDLTNKQITLKRHFAVSQSIERTPFTVLVKEQHFIIWDKHTSSLKTFDLNTGEILKEVPYPGKVKANETLVFPSIRSSPTSEFLAVSHQVIDEDYNRDYDSDDSYNGYDSRVKRYQCCIFSKTQLAFLSDLVIDTVAPPYNECRPFAIHHKWLAYFEEGTFTVYNIQTRQILMRHEDCYIDGHLYLWDNSFIFIEKNVSPRSRPRLRATRRLRKFSPEQNTLTTLVECEGEESVSMHGIGNSKALMVSVKHNESFMMWISSGEKVKKFALLDSPFDNIFVNKSFTRLLIADLDFLHDAYFVHYSW